MPCQNYFTMLENNGKNTATLNGYHLCGSELLPPKVKEPNGFYSQMNGTKPTPFNFICQPKAINHTKLLQIPLNLAENQMAFLDRDFKDSQVNQLFLNSGKTGPAYAEMETIFGLLPGQGIYSRGGESKLNNINNECTPLFTYNDAKTTSRMFLEEILPFDYFAQGREGSPETSAQTRQSVGERSLLQPQIPHLLLVEDNIIALRLLESITKQAGCDFTSTLDGEMALELAKTKQFDLIVTDIGLPGMSGIEMTIYIRHWERGSKKVPTPIVGLTAHSLASSADECLEAGMNKVFAKPINLQTMKDIISSLVIPNGKAIPRGVVPDRDMPENEEELFALDDFPLFNLQQGINNLGSIALLKELLNLMLIEVIPKDEHEIEQAYMQGDWPSVEKIAHKMKSGALYCGTTRLQYACQYLERYSQAGHSNLLDKLYHQLIQVLAQTKEEISHWLNQEKNQNRSLY
ncbi:response regulator [Legionella jordanis]|nr:response regulator [Legionella jordanis]